MQSCDICRKRKVKCDRRSPCARCRRLHQPCTYTDILRKKGPKFLHTYPSIYTWDPATSSSSSLGIITNTSTSSMGDLTSASISSEVLTSSISMPELQPRPRSLKELGFNMNSGDMRHTKSKNLLTGPKSNTGTRSVSEVDDLELKLDLEFGQIPSFNAQPQQNPELGQDVHPGLPDLDHRREMIPDLPIDVQDTLLIYNEKVHPLFPVVDLQEIRLGHSPTNGNSALEHALLYSICASVHADQSFSHRRYEHQGHQQTCEKYLQLALQHQERYNIDVSHFLQQDQHDDPGVRKRILIPFFLFQTYWNLGREKHAWWYLRECIALLFSARMHREDTYQKLEVREAEMSRMIFWGVFIAEWTFCLHDKPITLRPWINPPSESNILDKEDVTPGFLRLITLFKGLDINLSGYWTPSGFMTPIKLTLPAKTTGPEPGLPVQQLNFLLSQEWLCAKIWRLGIPGQPSKPAEFVASSENAQWRVDEPIRIGQATLAVLRRFKDVLRDSWNRILDHKLYDICECLCDVGLVMQRQSGDFGADAPQILTGLWDVLGKFNGRSTSLLAGLVEANI